MTRLISNFRVVLRNCAIYCQELLLQLENYWSFRGRRNWLKVINTFTDLNVQKLQCGLSLCVSPLFLDLYCPKFVGNKTKTRKLHGYIYLLNSKLNHRNDMGKIYHRFFLFDKWNEHVSDIHWMWTLNCHKRLWSNKEKLKMDQYEVLNQWFM